MSTETRPAFTPGPWRVDEWDYPDDTDKRTWGSGWTICSTEKNIAVAFDQGDDKLESAANADLIAAAPELYAALKLVTEALVGMAAYRDGAGWPMVDTARAALAKADGSDT